MRPKALQPVILGRGMAGHAMQRALNITAQMHPELDIRPAVTGKRGYPLKELAGGKDSRLILLIANPHALHAPTIIEAQSAGFDAVIVEKPACVSLEQAESVEKVSIPVSVCHGYRVMWGPRFIKEYITAGNLGEIISIEGRYWQSSAAQQALSAAPLRRQVWKNDPLLNGPSDALFDIGSHWLDMAIFFNSDTVTKGSCWLSYANSEASHRDTHAHLDVVFSKGAHARASISKTIHGAANDFEISVLGTRKSAHWAFMRPDVVEIGEGGEKRIISRTSTDLGSGSRPFHALGWLEGYVEIISQTMLKLSGLPARDIPTLSESVNLMKILLSLKTDTP